MNIKLWLDSGKFESSIRIPLMASEAAKKEFVDSWLMLMEAGLKCRSSSRA